MKSLEFKGFVGLDLRNIPGASNPLSLRSAKNVEVTAGKGLKTRDQLRLYANVAAGSKGLYVVNDALRCALPYPAFTGTVPRPPLNITYDLLCDRNNAPHAATVDAVESVTAWDNRPYLCVRLTVAGNTKYRHYFIPAAQATGQQITAQAGSDLTIPGLDADVGVGATIWLQSIATTYRVTVRVGDVVTVTPAPPVLSLPKLCTVWWPASNKVALPFEPGPPVITAAEKVFGADVAGRNVWFCSTEFGPDNWTALNDAGFIATSRNADGDQPLRGFGIYRTQLAVMYDSVVQLWAVDPDPANMELVATIGGAGTKFPGSVENVMGDLFYFSNGGFRTMSDVVTTGQPKDSDIGAYIRALTKDLSPTYVNAVWSPWRQQYLCAIDGQVFVLTYSPQSGTMGWGRWELPWPVSSVVEWRNRLYFRRADADEVWTADPEYEREADFSWHAYFNSSDGDVSDYLKHYKFLDLHMVGNCSISYGFDPDDDTDVVEMAAFTDSTPRGPFNGKIATVCAAISVATRFDGTGPWELDSFTHRFSMGNLV